MSGEWWAFIFLMLVMKVPIVYLGAVIWYACKEPKPEEGAAKLAELPEPQPWCPWRLRRFEPLRPHPHAPTRRVPRTPRVSHAYARHE